MLNQRHVAHPQAFGFVALRGLLDDGRAAALTGEVAGVLGAGDPR
ncbi:MAG TPA: hypothetical protein VFA45_00245 [Actinomycetes bacterium]|nr:hypothetical protein [Actinomycetes bacterium]